MATADTTIHIQRKKRETSLRTKRGQIKAQMLKTLCKIVVSAISKAGEFHQRNGGDGKSSASTTPS